MMNNLTLYKELRTEMKGGDALSFMGTGILSTAIGKFTHRSHVAGIVQSLALSGFPPRNLLIEANEGEVNPRVLSKVIEDYAGEVWWHKLKLELDEYRDAMVYVLWDQVGKPYDYDDLINNAFGHVDIGVDKQFCSETVSISIIGTVATPTIPIEVLKSYLPDKCLNLLMDGKALRPGGIAVLPIYEGEVQIV